MISYFRRFPFPHSKPLIGNQLKQLLRTWLSPADPSINHNIARKTQHEGTAVWFFRGSIFVEWKSSGTLLWIHGKRVFLSTFFLRSCPLIVFGVHSRLWEKHHLVRSSSPSACRTLFFCQLLHHSRPHGCLRIWISYHGLFLLRF